MSLAIGILIRWTFLLGAGWIAESMLRQRHPRWRLILWRGILCLGLLLPFLRYLPFPSITIPVAGAVGAETEFAQSSFPDTRPKPISPPGTPAPSLSKSPASTPETSAPRPLRWKSILLSVWVLGLTVQAAQLLRLHLQLFRLRKNTDCPGPELQRLVEQVRLRLQVRRRVNVQISEVVTSPFVCGVFKPMIILPASFAGQFSPVEMFALLSHEIGHLRGRDLPWCVAWRWMKAACWFHPLVWRVPTAHNLACEQEADRCATSQLADEGSYAQLLARLALRLMALPALESELTVNGTAQITRRLNQLAQKSIGAWNWRHSTVAFAAGLLVLLTLGCHLSPESRVSATTTFNEVLVTVEDENGKPIEGAVVAPDGFRVKGIHGADAYHWGSNLFGGPVKAITDGKGTAYVKYPVVGIPEEKELTGKIIFSVSHPDYATVRVQEYSVDSPEKPIQLARGIHFAVSGYFGANRQPVIDIVPSLSEENLRKEDWQKKDNGVFTFNKLSSGAHILQLMGRLPSGEIVYSDSIPFNATKGKDYNYALEMKPGIRLEGRIDDKVARPVKNGRVLIDVRPKEFPAWVKWSEIESVFKKYGGVSFWQSYRTIAEDGTFVFESIPPGGLDVIVHGDGFVSQNGGEFAKNFAVPQAFTLNAPTTKIVVTTEPSATLEVTAKTKWWQKPVTDAVIYLNPNVIRMNGIFGCMRHSNEEPFRTLDPLPDVPYFATTDTNGNATIQNVPPIAEWMDVVHPRFQVPLQEPAGWRNRNVRLELSPGATNKFALTLEPKGADFIGSN